MRHTMPTTQPRPTRPVPPIDETPERLQPRRAPGKDEITPAFDDSDETPVLPARLRRAERDGGATK